LNAAVPRSDRSAPTRRRNGRADQRTAPVEVDRDEVEPLTGVDELPRGRERVGQLEPDARIVEPEAEAASPVVDHVGVVVDRDDRDGGVDREQQPRDRPAAVAEQQGGARGIGRQHLRPVARRRLVRQHLDRLDDPVDRQRPPTLLPNDPDDPHGEGW
jgi:hypothetical protein